MDGFQKAVVAVIITIVLALAGLGMEATYLCHKLDKAYIEAGYTRQALPGVDSPRWVLPEEKDSE